MKRSGDGVTIRMAAVLWVDTLSRLTSRCAGTAESMRFKNFLNSVTPGR